MNFRTAAITAFLGLTLAGCATIEEKTPKVDVNSPQAAYEKAVISMRYNLVDEALKYLGEALSRDPQHFPSKYLIGVAYLKKGSLAEARAAFEMCAELNPDNPDVHAYLGSIYQSLSLGDQAEAAYLKAFDIDHSYNSSFSLAKLYFEQDKLDLALKYIELAVEKDNRSAHALNLQGVILNTLKFYPEAILSFLNAVKVDSSHTIAGVNLAIAYINNGEKDKARDLLEQILSVVQDDSLKEKINEYLEKIKDKH